MAAWAEVRQWQPDVIGQVGDHLAAQNGQVIGLQDELDGAKPVGWVGITGLAVAAIGYLLLPTLPVLLAAAAMSAFAGSAVAGDFVGDTPLRLGLTLLAVAVLWAALALSGLLAGQRHRTAALVVAGLIGLLGAQLVLGDSAASDWAYALTLLVAVGCVGAYALDRSILLLAVGVVGVTLAVAEAVADWTDGAAGGAAAVLVAGAVLLLGSGVALRLHRRRSL